MQLLAICENVPETYYNMKVLCELLKLENIEAIYTMDFKLANMVLGLSV